MEPENQIPEYDQVCRQATFQISQAVDATSARLFEWDSVSGVISVVAEYYSPHISPPGRRHELGAIYELSEFPTTLRCLETNQVYIVYADSTDADMADRAWLAAVNGKTAIKIPIAVHDTTIGFIELCESRWAREWMSDEIHLCQTLASFAATTIENARLHRTQQRHTKLLTLLQNATRRVPHGHGSDHALQPIVEIVANSLNALVGVALLDETGRELVMREVAGPSSSFMPTSYRQSVEQGILGYVARTGSSYLSNNVHLDPNYLGVEGVLRGSELAVPIRRAGKVIGVLNIESETIGAFSATDVTAIEILAGHLAAAMENVHLEAQTRRQLNELTLLHEIAIAGSVAQDIDALFNQVMPVIATSLHSDSFELLLLDKTANILRLHSSCQNISSDALRITIPLGKGITGQVAATGVARIVDNVRADPHYIQAESGIRSEMAVPLRVGGDVFGVLNAEARQQAAYSEDDLHLLVTIAEQLAAAIGRIRAQEQAARADARLVILNEMEHKAAGALDGVRLLRDMTEVLHHYLKSDYALAATIHHATGTLVPVAHTGNVSLSPLNHSIPLNSPQNIQSLVATQGEVIYVSDAVRDPRYAAMLSDAGSELCVPMRLPDGTIMGLLDLKSRRPDAFDPDDIEIVKNIASQMAVALINARLHEETERRFRELSGLYELSQTLSRINDPDQLYGPVVERVAQLLNVEQCGIALYDPIAKTLAMQAPAYGLRSEQVTRYRAQVPDPLPAWMQGEALLSHDPMEDAQTNPGILSALAIELGERNSLIVPLLMSQSCLGIVRVANKVNGESFTQDDVRLLTIFAGQAAAAIQNTRLLADNRRRVERLAELERVGAVLTSGLEFQPLVEALYREMTPLFNAEALAVYVLDAHHQRLHCGQVRHGLYYSYSLENTAESIETRIIQTGQPLVISDADRERVTLSSSGLGENDLPRSWLGTPLFLHGQPIGAISIQSYSPGQFDDQDLWLISQMAPQIALAVHNVNLHRDASRRASELATLQRVGKRLSAASDRTDMVYAVIEGAQALIGASNVCIFRYDAGGDQLTLEAACDHHFHRSQSALPPQVMALATTVAHRGEPMVINDIHQQTRRDESYSGEPHTIAGIPIKRAGVILAVLCVTFADQAHPLAGDEMRALTMLADQAALALDTAARSESERRQRAIAEALHEMAILIENTLDIDQVLHGMLDPIRCAVTCDAACVALIAGDRLKIRAMSGSPGNIDPDTERVIGNLPLASQIVATAQPVALADIQNPLFYPRDIIDSIGVHKVRAILGVPLVRRGQVIGIIYLARHDPSTFTFEEMQHVQAFASQAVLALANSRANSA